jgi:hypothetical protein
MARKSITPPTDTIWELPDTLWDCLESILDERYPKKPPAGHGRTCVKCSTALFSACVAAVSGTSFPNASAVIAPSIVGFSGFARTDFLKPCGGTWSKPVTIWPAFTGIGRVPMAAWAKPGSGGKKVGKNPTDRGKLGTKTSLLVDEQGGPLGRSLKEPTSPTANCWRKPSMRWSSNGPSRHPNALSTCAWTKVMTTRPASRGPRRGATRRTSVA